MRLECRIVNTDKTIHNMNTNNKKTELTIPVEKEFYGQECQDAEITKKFKELHVKIVNEVISFCKDNGIIVDEFYLHADGLDESIKLGSWQPATDSQFELVRDTEGNEDKETFCLKAITVPSMSQVQLTLI